MIGRNESSATLMWLSRELNEPATRAWTPIRDEMRARPPIGMAIQNWLSDMWIARSCAISPMGPQPKWDSPDDIAEFPPLGARALVEALGPGWLATHRQVLGQTRRAG